MSLRPPFGSLNDFTTLASITTNIVRNRSAANPLNTEQILQGTNYNVLTDGIPNVAAVGNLDFAISTGGVYADDTSSKNRFQIASYVYNSLNQPTVALFGYGKGKHVWGINEAGYTDGAGHVAIGNELDYGNVGTMATTTTGSHALPITTLNVTSTTGAAATGIVVSASRFWRYTGITATSFTGLTFENGTNSGTINAGASVAGSVGGTATGLVIVAEGGNVGGSPPGPYIQMQSNIACQSTHGIVFNNSGQPCVMTTGSLIKASGEIASYGLNLSLSSFTGASAFIPVNSGSTTASYGVIVKTEGGFANTGAGIYFQAAASSTVSYGIRFNDSVVSATGVGIYLPITAAVGLDFLNSTFSTAAIRMGVGSDISIDTGTGTKIGTGTTQKIGFWNATPVVKPTGVAVTAAGIHAALVTIGLIGA